MNEVLFVELEPKQNSPAYDCLLGLNSATQRIRWRSMFASCYWHQLRNPKTSMSVLAVNWPSERLQLVGGCTLLHFPAPSKDSKPQNTRAR